MMQKRKPKSVSSQNIRGRPSPADLKFIKPLFQSGPSKSNSVLQQYSHYLVEQCTNIVSEKNWKPMRLTPVMITCNESILTDVDIRALVEMGLSIIRFKMSVSAKSEKIKLINMIEHAQRYMCEKYDVSHWPLATCLDLPNATIRTGFIDESLKGSKVIMEKNTIVTITSDIRYWDKCTATLLYIDDTYTIQHFFPGLELTLLCGIVLSCTEIIDKKTVKFIVIEGGEFQNNQFVCLRGVRYHRPPLMKRDLELLKFAKEFRFSVITIYTVRYPSTVVMVKKLLDEDYNPIILCAICDQQGLDSIEDILNVADGIILARDFLVYQLKEKNRLFAIQMYIAAKCKTMGKSFFLSGDVLQRTLEDGSLYGCELSDITNGVIQGAGFLLRHHGDANNVLKALNVIDSVCREVESTVMPHDYLRLVEQLKPPVNAAEAAVMGCMFMAVHVAAVVIIVPTVTGKTAIQLSNITPHINILALTRSEEIAQKLQVHRGVFGMVYNRTAQEIGECMFMAVHVAAVVIIVPTVTGKTAIQLSNITPHINIVALTRSEEVAQKLQVHRGVFGMVYNRPPKFPFVKEMEARVQYAVNFCVKMEILQYQNAYVVLRKSKYECSYCDHVSSHIVSDAIIKEYQNPLRTKSAM